MSRAVDERIAAAVAEAEQRGSCFAPANEAERRAADRRLVTARPHAGELVSPVRGLYARAGFWQGLDPVARSAAVACGLATQHPDWTFCGPTAAILYGLPVSYADAATVHVSTKGSSFPDFGGGGVGVDANARVAVCHHELRGAPALVSGVRVTGYWRTVFDCLAGMAFPDALAVADAVVRVQMIAPEDLAQVLRGGYPRCPGVRRAAEVAGLADARAENGGESVARGVLIELGRTPTDLQVTFAPLVQGDPVMRVDFLWVGENGILVAGEFDGRVKYEDPAHMGGRDTVGVLLDERQRESRITAYGVPIVRFTMADLRRPEQLARRLDAFGVPLDGGRRRAHPGRGTVYKDGDMLIYATE